MRLLDEVARGALQALDKTIEKAGDDSRLPQLLAAALPVPEVLRPAFATFVSEFTRRFLGHVIVIEDSLSIVRRLLERLTGEPLHTGLRTLNLALELPSRTPEEAHYRAERFRDSLRSMDRAFTLLPSDRPLIEFCSGLAAWHVEGGQEEARRHMKSLADLLRVRASSLEKQADSLQGRAAAQDAKAEAIEVVDSPVPGGGLVALSANEPRLRKATLKADAARKRAAASDLRSQAESAGRLARFALWLVQEGDLDRPPAALPPPSS